MRIRLGICLLVASITALAGTVDATRDGSLVNNGSDVGTVTSLSSPNATIAISTPTTTPTLDVAYGTGANTALQGDYSGNSAFVTAGTIATGVWHGTTIGTQYGGSGANLSATGGAGQYVKQTTSGGAFTVGTIPAADVVGGASLQGTGVTGSISGALTLGVCDSGTAAVTGATNAMAVIATPTTYPGDGVVWMAYVSATGTVTVKECGLGALTPAATTYQVRVIQ